MSSTEVRPSRSRRTQRASRADGQGGSRRRSETETGHSLPDAPNSLLGRGEELVELGELLERSRLVTLTGAPGVGKTRLALELATRHREAAALVELAPVGDPALVHLALASALSVQEVPGQGLMETVITNVGERRLLVVLDNCEHLIGACAELVESLLAGCPELSVLTTSREPLRLEAERVWQVPPLPVPDHADSALPEALMNYTAVCLFVERAGAVQSGYLLNAYVAPHVAEICRRLDGIPLAIELAAARVDMLTPAEIARRLDDRFGLLVDGSPNAQPRHQTLEAALDWSYELLSAAERALLRRLSVFVGGFELEPAETVCAGGEVKTREVPELLAALVSRSLVAVDVGSTPHARYRLLETIRAFASDRLEEAREAAGLREAHAGFYLALAEQAEPELTGPAQAHWLERLDSERDNLRSALDWSLGHAQGEWALRLAGALVLFWRVRGHFSEGRDLLEAALSAGQGEAPALRAKALWGAGFLTLMAGDPQGAVPSLEQSLSGFREQGDLRGCARALLILGNCKQYFAETSVLPLLEESAALAREAGDRWCLLHALGVAGFENAKRGELPAARRVFEECLDLARDGEDKQGLRFGLMGLGSVAHSQGDYRLAETLLEEALAIACALGEDYSRVEALRYLGWLALDRGDYVRARELLAQALALIPESALPEAAGVTLLLLGRVAHAAGDPSGARRRFEEARTRAGTAIPIMALQWKGDLAVDEGDSEESRRLLDDALAAARMRGQKDLMAQALHGLGRLARDAGDARRAAALHNEAIELQREIGAAPAIVASFEALAGLAGAAGCYQHAARLLGAASTLRTEIGYARVPWESAGYEADLALVRAGLGAADFEEAIACGGKLSVEDVVALALKGGGWRGRPSRGWASLTEREQQVAQLAAEGLTNPEIAQSLVITPGTVKDHLSHVFAKLGVSRRAGLALAVLRRNGATDSHDGD